ncbi:opioid growth factor receptor conserved region-domain-containing protein [Xylariales sp. AK1849]|nr:opioid growth factor receptor conserved region-domain-containing protein [Xylariales sp. AK1849]
MTHTHLSRLISHALFRRTYATASNRIPGIPFRTRLCCSTRRFTHHRIMSSSAVVKPSAPALRKLVDFYDPVVKGADGGGRTLEQILQWGDDRLEGQHDYIQTLFPLPEGSVFNYMAPVIDETTYLYFRQHAGLRQNVRRAFERMLAFYGLKVMWEAGGEDESERKVTIVEAENCKRNYDYWVRRIDHNHLRITRILRSLRVLGLEQEADAYFEALKYVYDKYRRIGASSLGFWQRAVSLPLHQAPDGDEVDWLEKYEAGDESEEDDGQHESGEDDRQHRGKEDDGQHEGGGSDNAEQPTGGKKGDEL